MKSLSTKINNEFTADVHCITPLNTDQEKRTL